MDKITLVCGVNRQSRASYSDCGIIKIDNYAIKLCN
jgi:hypothetical protein